MVRLLPETVRNSTVFLPFKERVARSFSCHQQNIYTRDYYESDVEKGARNSAPIMVASILEEFHPDSVIDLGCGTGALLEEFSRKGVSVTGLEYSTAGCAICREKGIEAIAFDARHDEIPGNLLADLTICCEVAEHLPEPFADRLVEILTSLSDIVIFTGAEPGQGGTDHVNEQPHTYWIEKFENRGFGFEQQISEAWRKSWEESGVIWWYFRNVMVFQKRDSPLG